MDQATCGHDGTCDGAGKCASYPDGTACGALACSTKAAAIVSPQCSKGTCMDAVLISCAPFNCDTTTNLCNVTCADKNDCAMGAMCKGAAGGLKTCQ